MQNKLTTGFFIFISMCSFTSQAQDYCESGAYSNYLTWVESVSSGSFINDTGPFNNQYGDQDHLYVGYADYTSQVIEWQVGINELTLEPGRFNHPFMADYPSNWRVWLDLDGDYEFAEDELLYDAGSFVTEVAAIDLSALQLSGELITRMRIAVSVYEDLPACGSIGDGEVEDYSVRITPASYNTLLVPEQFLTIQSAVDAAQEGDRILVNDGLYEEDVVVNKPLIIESVNGSDSTSVSSSANGIAFLVQSPFVTIQGFELTTAFLNQYAGIYFFEGADDGQSIDNRCSSRVGGQNNYHVLIDEADRITVKGLYCDKFGIAGIWAEDTAESQFINNTITNQRYHGIYLRDGFEVLIDNNTLNENKRTGLAIDFSNSVTVSGNQCSQNVLNIFPAPPLYLNNNHNGFGISVVNSDDVVISGNQCNNNSHAGIHLKLTDDATLAANLATFNDNQGLLATQANGLMMDGNQLTDNMIVGVELAYSDQASVVENVIDNNGNMGLSLQSVSNSQIDNNIVYGDQQSVVVLNSNNNQWINNTFTSTEPTQLCQFQLDQSTGNQLYLNAFVGANTAGICSINNSQNQWFTVEVLEYQYLGLQFGDQLGNYYSDGDHTDSNGNGISDQPYALPGSEPVDGFALSDLPESYIFQ